MDKGNGTATLSGTPAPGTEGTYSLTLTAANGILPNASQTFTLIIGQPPTITSTNTATFIVGIPLTFTVTTTGDPPPSLSEMGNLPAGITFMDNGNGTATLSGTPAEGSTGVYTLILTASNGISPNAVQIFTLTIVQQTVTTPTTTLLQISPHPAALRQAVTLTAIVSPFAATGTVTFFDGTVLIGTIPVINGSAVLTISSLNVGTHFIFAVYNGNETYLASTSAPVTLVIETALPPRHAKGFQKANQFATQTEYVNFLTWEAPSEGTTIVAYQIYRDKFLRKLVGEISSHQHLHFKDHNRQKDKTYTYFIVSVDEFGNLSKSVQVTIKEH